MTKGFWPDWACTPKGVAVDREVPVADVLRIREASIGSSYIIIIIDVQLLTIVQWLMMFNLLSN